MFRLLTIAGAGLLVLAAAGFALFGSSGPVRPARAPSVRRGAVGAAAAGSGARATAAAGPGVVWQVLTASSAREIENAYLPARARGTFLILDVREHNAGQQALSPRQAARLELGGSSYAVDAAAESALELAGHPTLAAGLGAQATETGWIAFDVPPSALSGSAKLCAGASGCTALSLPSPSAT